MAKRQKLPLGPVLVWALPLLVQIIFTNHIPTGNYFWLFVLPYAVIHFPVGQSGIRLMCSAFALGIVCDFFTVGTVFGVWAAALTASAYLRGFILRMIVPSLTVKKRLEPSIANFGLAKQTIFSLMVMAVFSIVFALFECVGSGDFAACGVRVLLSWIIGSAICLLSDFLFQR